MWASCTLPKGGCPCLVGINVATRGRVMRRGAQPRRKTPPGAAADDVGCAPRFRVITWTPVLCPARRARVCLAGLCRNPELVVGKYPGARLMPPPRPRQPTSTIRPQMLSGAQKAVLKANRVSLRLSQCGDNGKYLQKIGGGADHSGHIAQRAASARRPSGDPRSPASRCSQVLRGPAGRHGGVISGLVWRPVDR